MRATHTTLAGLALALLASSAAADFTVTGNFEYEDKSWTYNGWNGDDPMRPIRRADVTVLDEDTQAVLGTGSTDQNGDFSIVCTSVGVTDIQVRVNADTDLDGSFQRIRVTTESNVEYSAFSPVFPSHDTNVDLDVGTTSVLKITSGGDEANPFNLLDMGVHAFEYITQGDIVEGTVTTVRLYWPSGGGSFAIGNGAHMADDDGYDDAVILHEIGHVVHNLYSDSDSPGGSHFFGDSDQDPRLSLGEGYATFFGGTVMIEQLGRQALYQDASGSAQTGGSQLRLRLETVEPYAADARGAADEVAVACTLFDILDDELSPDQSDGVDDDGLVSTSLIGSDNVHQAWWDVFTGPVDTAANLSLNDCWDGWFAVHGTDGLHPELEALYDLRQVKFFNDVDEPNSFIDFPTPVSPSADWSGVRTLYASEDALPVPGGDDRDWYSAEMVVGSVVDFRTRYPNGVNDADTQADTEVSIFDPTDTKRAESDTGGVGRNGAIAGFTIDQTGTWKFRVRTTNTTSRRYGKYDYRIRYDFENELPQITSGPTAVPATITDDATSLLSVTASDAQALSYVWTPLAGGSIVGAGASVSFDPPSVASTTVFDVQLDVVDTFGATTTEVVQITVDPGGPTCGNGAAATSGGAGKPGSLGVPVLTPVNLPVLPSSDFELQLTNALPSTTCWVIIGLSRLDAPFDMGTMYPSPDILVPLATDPTGQLIVPLPLGGDPAGCGLTLTWQFMVQGDPGAAGFKQTAQSNWVETVFGS